MSRFLSALSLAAVAVIALVGPASATGQTGNYLFIDAMGTPGSKCIYQQEASSIWYAHKFTARPPSLWWPDTNSSKNNQHGKVGWRLIVQWGSGSSWQNIKQSPIQKATAYEDSQNPYGSATKAPLTRMSVTINAHNYADTGNFRVVVKGFWYKADGSVMGSQEHVVYWYRSIAGPYKTTVNTVCGHSG